MLVQDFLQIPRAYDGVRELILNDPRALVSSNVADAYRDGEQLCMQLKPPLRHSRLGKKVLVDIGTPYERNGRIVLPIHWWAKGATYFFPRLDGDLEVAPFGDNSTQLTFSARYDPPLGGVGRKLDRILLHHLTEASVRSFLHGMDRSLRSTSHG